MFLALYLSFYGIHNYILLFPVSLVIIIIIIIIIIITIIIIIIIIKAYTALIQTVLSALQFIN